MTQQHPLLKALDAVYAAIEAHNVDVTDFNALVTDNDTLEAELAGIKSKHAEQQALMLHVHEDRKALLAKHNESVTLANEEITRLTQELAIVSQRYDELAARHRRLETESASNAVELKQLRELDPKSMKKRLDKMRERNDELKKENAELATKLANSQRALKEANKSKADVERPLWSLGSEKIVAHNHDSVVALEGGRRIALSCVVWWEHERGMRLMCAYDPERDSIMICDPRDENDNMFTPSKAAEAAMLTVMKNMRADKLKQLEAKRAA